MANKKDTLNASLSVVVPEKEEEAKEPTVTVFLPKLEEEGNGIKVDQYEHVTISNVEETKEYKVRRGERVEVPVSVFMILKEKYGKDL
jgi:hypothetical protein